MGQALVALFVFTLAPQDFGKPATRSAGASSRSGAWAAEWRAKGAFEYNSNVFLLDGDHIDRLNDDLPADQASGRYDDMESVDDLLFIPGLRFEAKGPSPLGRKLEGWIDLEIPVYTQNARRTHLDLDFGVRQAVGSDGRLSLSFGILPEYFKKNYLADGVDTSGNGNISSDERVYEAGVYLEFEVELEYRHRIVDRTAQKPFGLDGTIALAYRDRAYDSPFDGRSETAPGVRLGLDFSYALRGGGKDNAVVLKWGLVYRYDAVDSPAELEVVLLDEAAFGVDFSGDGDTTDINARSIQTVDRTRAVQSYGLSLGASIGPAVDVGLEYTRYLSDYDSDNPLDVSHSGREDTREDIGLFGKYGFSKSWDAKLGFEWRRQFTDRSGDPGSQGETTDYKRNVFSIALSYRW